jgi:polysaccharide pyruvyl transferase WcaK-like protein
MAINNIQRRSFLKQSGMLTAGLLLGPAILKATGKANPVIFIVSGWQDINIGDIAHTPGLIALLKKQMPGATIVLWKRSASKPVEAMLANAFPDVKIVLSKLDSDQLPVNEEVRKMFKEADFFIHGSGPTLVAADYLTAWHKHTDKPFGVFGITLEKPTPENITLLRNASFIFTRETASIKVLRDAGLDGTIAFAPDATFALTIHDDTKASAFLKENKLEDKKFICVIPRLRRTPYYKIPGRTGYSDKQIADTEALNAKNKEPDHAKLREAMIAWVRKTGNKVLVCPEMTYQVDIMDELLINPLPDDVKPFVIKRSYWMPDEAASVYAKAYAVLSFECHSPIIAAANGTPCFYLRQPQDTIKGQMYYDLGLASWTFEIEKVTGSDITKQLMSVVNNYPKALKNLAEAMARVNKQYADAFEIVRKNVDYKG